MKNLFITVICCLFQFTIINAQQIEWFSSTNENCWQKGKKVKHENRQPNSKLDIEIGDQKVQYIEGFGGCFNEIGWDALIALDEKSRDKVIKELFSAEGANFTYNRMPIGASDYGLNFYSLNDVVDDFDMINFSIARDRHILIPYIKAAQKANPDFKIWGVPWSPPAWMKTNNHYASSSDDTYNGLPSSRSLDAPVTAFKMQRGYLEAHALYFVKFIRAYEKEGINIQAINVQNEPCSSHMFPGCNWRSQDLTYFIGEFLGPKFEKERIDTEIYFGTINNDNLEYFRTALNDSKASKYIKGVGFQWEGKRAIPTIHKEYPDLKMMQTESECGDASNSWKSAEYTWSLINHYLRNGANSYAYWNMVLDHTGKSTWGWAQNTLISINKETKQVTYNPEYYIMKHLSHYVKPGAYRLKTNEGDDHLAFINPDNKIILVIVNIEDHDKTVKVGIKDKVMEISLKAKSFNTLCYI